MPDFPTATRLVMRALAAICLMSLLPPRLLPWWPALFPAPTDEKGNAFFFGLYIDGELASSIRVHVASKIYPDFTYSRHGRALTIFDGAGSQPFDVCVWPCA